MQLPQPYVKGTVSLEEALNSRRSWKKFNYQPLSDEQISQLLWAGYGVRSLAENKRSRTVPSAGGIRPLTLYLACPGELHKYLPLTHETELLGTGDWISGITKLSVGQLWMAEASGIFIVACNYIKCTERYGQRGTRYALIEAGCVGQNITLQAQALNLRSRVVGAFRDRSLAAFLKLPKDEAPVLLLAVGFYADGKK